MGTVGLNRVSTALSRLWCAVFLRWKFAVAARTLARPPVFRESGQRLGDVPPWPPESGRD